MIMMLSPFSTAKSSKGEKTRFVVMIWISRQTLILLAKSTVPIKGKNLTI